MYEWQVIEVLGTWAGAISAIVAIIVALYVNHDAHKPDVVAYLEHDRDHSAVNFVVANLGNGVARNINIDGFDMEMVMEPFKDVVNKSFAVNGIPVLTPGTSRSTTILAGDAMRTFATRNSTVAVSYDLKRFPFGTKRAKDDFVLDYRSFAIALYTTNDIHEIKCSLERLAKSIEKMSQTQMALYASADSIRKVVKQTTLPD